MDQNSNGGTQDGPKIFRPIPRRPFNLASPPMISRKDESPSPAPGRDSNTSPQPRITAADLRFLLDPRSPFNTSASPAASGAGTSGLDSSNISRATSFRNLTSSTLFGIFSDPSEPGTAATTPGVGRSTSNLRNGFYFGEQLDEETEDETDGAANVLGIAGDARDDDDDDDDETYQETITLRPKRQRRVSSITSTIPTFRGESSSSSDINSGNNNNNPVMGLFWSLLRTILLFVLGMGYGVLVTRLPNGDNVTGGYGWRYLTFWGAAGVVLGRLLPWFDQVWEETFGKRARVTKQEKERRRAAAAAEAAAALLQQPPSKSSPRKASVTTIPTEVGSSDTGVTSPPEADWPLVVRSIGAFVGIVFAIRRLPWTSTMQVSITLALANPFLWYLIDRSKPGFLLSAAVGVTGSAILMGLGDPDVMPAPVSGGMGAYHDHILSNGQPAMGVLNGTTTSGLPRGAAGTMGGMGGASGNAAVIETGIWMISVLFCSCVCFGNIGRRLALNKSAASRGRWGGVR
ncbi:insulin-induced protein-domain-containing protein [Pseudoneurospora amorphoporcata]|uniref:Insulin-induced protein-domain-containing protein n=1 Tax=Pseudoneurospora amorphoporcata TaxID=241081 RepID=A0AAN6P3I3_9PEZI|nr:insulin-induced protein-domain-containing protein [Pseudoneurospora amorphoporcata]